MRLSFQKLIILIVFLVSSTCKASEKLMDNDFLKPIDVKKLWQASYKNEIEIVKDLLRQNYNINEPSEKCNNMTPLMFVVLNKSQETFNMLLEYRNNDQEGPEVDLQTKNGNTALIFTLFMATTSKDLEQSKKLAYPLLKRGVDHTIKNKGNLTFKDFLTPKKSDNKTVKNIKLTIEKQSKRIIQERCNLIFSLLYAWKIPEALIKEFASYLFIIDEDNFEIDIENYLRSNTK